MPEIVSIDIGVQQFVIAYLALGQDFSCHHAAAHRSHVFTVPVLNQGYRMIFARTRLGVYVLSEILRRFSAGTAHAPLGLRRQIGMRPWRHAQGIGFIAWDLHIRWPLPVLGDDLADLDRVSNQGLQLSCARCCHPSSQRPA